MLKLKYSAKLRTRKKVGCFFDTNLHVNACRQAECKKKNLGRVDELNNAAAEPPFDLGNDFAFTEEKFHLL